MRQKRSSVVVLGGGTGTYMTLLALKKLPVDITAILTMVDDGGSNRVLRDQFGLLPTSGICQAISALSDDESLLRDLFTYRFHQGDGLSGMRFGNLFIAAVSDIVGSQKLAIEETQRLLKVQGRILPISYDDVRLVATYDDGTELIGEHAIDEPVHGGGKQIVTLRTEPLAKVSQEAHDAIMQADLVIFGPGDFYTNTAANFVVDGVPEALAASPAKKLFVVNLMTKYSETDGFTVRSFLDRIDQYYSLSGLDAAVINSNQAYPEDAMQRYQADNAAPVADDIDGSTYQGVQLHREDLLADAVFDAAAGDNLPRSILRHDPDKFAAYLQRQWL